MAKNLLLLLAVVGVCHSFVVVLHPEDKCEAEIHHLCHDATNTTATAECIVKNEKELEAVCGDRIECFADEYRDCAASKTVDERYACLEKNEEQLEKVCPMLDCQIEVHTLCGNAKTPAEFMKCAEEHKADLEKACKKPEEEEAEELAATLQATVQAAEEIASKAFACRKEIHDLCANQSSTPEVFFTCLESHEVQLEKTCGKQIECPIAEHKDCGFNKTVSEWMTCLSANVATLEPVCPQVDCEVTVYQLCNASKTREEMAQCVQKNHDAISKVCKHDEEEEMDLVDIDSIEIPDDEEEESEEPSDIEDNVNVDEEVGAGI